MKFDVKFEVKQGKSIKTNPKARRVSDNDAREDMYAACKFGEFQWKTLLSPVIEEVKPTTPARRERMMKKPVAIFPIGKYIGNMRAGIDKVAAACIFTQMRCLDFEEMPSIPCP
ncbi:unnamed protein product [Dovyalis caffra]|uniref:Uncharacterized protein n=1 Tax=Dovyalis caffra TaxID=77055 RepID=A0AAV1RF94_9ROSI|nr:unnamed protein product [Dovyalis caffra]